MSIVCCGGARLVPIVTQRMIDDPWRRPTHQQVSPLLYSSNSHGYRLYGIANDPDYLHFCSVVHRIARCAIVWDLFPPQTDPVPGKRAKGLLITTLAGASHTCIPLSQRCKSRIDPVSNKSIIAQLYAEFVVWRRLQGR